MRDPPFKSAQQRRRVRRAHNEAHDRCNDQVLDPAGFKQGNGTNEAGFRGALDQKTVGNKDDPI